MTLSYLDKQAPLQLSPQELLEISQEIAQDYAPCLSKSTTLDTQFPIFSKHELLAISEEIAREYTPHAHKAAPALVLLPVDPLHLHAYWHIEPKLPEPEQPTLQDLQLTLRIFSPHEETEQETPAVNHWFDTLIDNAQRHITVTLPTPTASQPVYSAAIGITTDNQEFLPLVLSNPATPPAQPVQTVQSQQLWALSGGKMSGSSQSEAHNQ